jgi:hypothetical protein
MTLSALDHWYRPDVMRSFHGGGYGDWLDMKRALRSDELLAWIGISADEVRQQAEGLLLSAGFHDPLGDWHRLIRLGRPAWWAKLRGDALVANDQRVAAEILLLFYEDLVEAGHSEPLARGGSRIHHPLDDRLGVSRAELDDTLTSFGLSPYPSLVLVLEGEVEMEVIPRVMEMMGIPQDRSFIDLHAARSVDRDFGFLVSYVARPGLGRELPQGGILLNRPVTRFLLTCDPEGRMKIAATPEGRRELRSRWVGELLARLPKQYRTRRMREAMTRMVHVATWNRRGDCFEYAHFTSRQIAKAILSVYPRTGAPDERTLAARIESMRNKRQGRFESLWDNWPGRKPTKVEVALELWPILEGRVQRAVSVGKPLGIPVVRVLSEAWRLATRYPRHSMALER